MGTAMEGRGRGSEEDCRTVRRPHPIFGVLYGADGDTDGGESGQSFDQQRPTPSPPSLLLFV